MLLPQSVNCGTRGTQSFANKPERHTMSNVNLQELEASTRPPVPRAEEQYDPEQITLDTEQVFLLYTTFCGETAKTSAALGVPERYVISLAEKEGWADRIKTIVELRKSKRPGDVERAINRAISFVQAQRYRGFLERVMQRMRLWTDQQLQDFLVSSETVQTKAMPEPETRVKVQSRALADFAVALQKCHEMCYMALNDTTPERGKRKESADDGELSLTAIHAQLARGMAQAEPKTAAGQLMAAQISVAQQQANECVRVDPNPYNKDL
jgi:hypothetical protein